MAYVLTIGGFIPARLNAYIGNHFAMGRMKKADRDLVLCQANMQRIPKAKGKRRIHYVVYFPKGHPSPDKDAYDKSLLDALKKAGLIVDDSPTWLECQRPDFVWNTDKTRKTVIHIEDL